MLEAYKAYMKLPFLFSFAHIKFKANTSKFKIKKIIKKQFTLLFVKKYNGCLEAN